MLAYIVLGSIIVCSLAFVMWLAMFILSRGINTNLETEEESHRIAGRQLFAGALLLAGAIGLGLVYYSMHPSAVIPEIGPGLPVEAPKVQQAIEAQAAAKAGQPVAVEPARPADVPRTGEAEDASEAEKPLPNPEVI